RSLAFHPSGHVLASGGDDLAVKLWDLDTRQETFAFRGHAARVQGVAFDPEGKRAASCSEDGVLKMWNPATGREVYSITESEASSPYTVSFGPPDRGLLAFGGQGRVWLRSAANGRKQCELERGVRSPVFSPDGRRLVAGSHSDKSAVPILDAV